MKVTPSFQGARSGVARLHRISSGLLRSSDQTEISLRDRNGLSVVPPQVVVHAGTLSSRDGVVVDHPQGAEAHPVRILMAAERKVVPGLKSDQLSVKALGSLAHPQ